MGVGGAVLMITMFVIKRLISCLAVNIRLMILISRPVVGYIQIEFPREKNADTTKHQ